MTELQICAESPISAIESLEHYFRKGRVSVIQAAFANTYFVHPDKVREKTPYYRNRARISRKHYPGKNKGQSDIWPGDGRKVTLDDNQYAQAAWKQYTGHRLMRGSGYGLRHIWGHPWDPDMFTAGWNFCYMPFWAGMLTENQHPHPELQKAIRQASWDLYFRNNPVCQPPGYIQNPGEDLDSILEGQPLLILSRESVNEPGRPDATGGVFDQVKEIRKQKSQSWVNIRKAARLLQDKKYEPFGTTNVENNAKSCVRKICRETSISLAQLEKSISLAQLENMLEEHSLGLSATQTRSAK